MHSTRTVRSCVTLAAAVLLAILVAVLAPAPADAADDYYDDVFKLAAEGVVVARLTTHVALYYRWGSTVFRVRPSSANPQRTGLVKLLPHRLPTHGPALMLYLSGGLILNLAYAAYGGDIRRSADLTGNGIDGVNVRSVDGHTYSFAAAIEPVRHVMIGLGIRRDVLRFQSPDFPWLVQQTISADASFVSVALVRSPDPKQIGARWFVAIDTAIPVGHIDDFTTSSYGASLGLSF